MKLETHKVISKEVRRHEARSKVDRSKESLKLEAVVY